MARYVGYIYKITNRINGKSYIGKTNNIKRRWNEHKHGKSGTLILSKAFAKYGMDNFDFSIIKTQEFPTIEEMNKNLSKLEIYYIGIYDTYKNGYNATIGGDGLCGYKLSLETKKKIGKANSGKIRTPEQIEKNRIGHLGIHPSEETRKKRSIIMCNRDKSIREKIAAKLRGRHRDPDMIRRAADKRKKPILRYDYNGNFVREYKSMKDTEFPGYKNIGLCCKGKIKSAYGCIWRYKTSDSIPKKIAIPILNNGKNYRIRCRSEKAINQYSKQGDYICNYISINDASRQTGISRTAISNCLNGSSRTAGGYIWNFIDKERYIL